MHFTKKDIKPEVYYIIDIGTYKLRAISVKLKNKGIQILEYVEKRQDSSYFINNECTNILGLSENIWDLISKFSKPEWLENPELICTYPFGEIFSKTKTINYKRSRPHTPITIKELGKIIESVEKLCLKKVSSEIYQTYGRDMKDIHIILSKVEHIKVDTQMYSKILGREWELLNIKLQNICVPREKHESLIQIWNSIWKKIYKVLPSEYCMPFIFPSKNMCVIDIGASTSNICIKKNGAIVALTKIPIGIGHLIDKIKSQSSYSGSQIIESLDSRNTFTEQKEAFIKVWRRSIGIALCELLEWEVCPHIFFVYGWGNNNSFITEALLHLDFAKYDVKIAKKIEFVEEDMSTILSNIENISLEHIKKIPLGMFALLLETKNILQKNGDIVSSSLENALHKLGY